VVEDAFGLADKFHAGA
jgi:hypothetical protein